MGSRGQSEAFGALRAPGQMGRQRLLFLIRCVPSCNRQPGPTVNSMLTGRRTLASVPAAVRPRGFHDRALSRCARTIGDALSNLRQRLLETKFLGSN